MSDVWASSRDRFYFLLKVGIPLFNEACKLMKTLGSRFLADKTLNFKRRKVPHKKNIYQSVDWIP